MIISSYIDIHAKPEEVFYWLEDPIRAMQWMTSVSKTELIREKADMVGTTFREVVEEHGQSTVLFGVVTEFVANQRLGFHLEGNYNSVDVIFVLEEHGETSRLTQKVDVRFKGLLRILSFFWGASFKEKTLRQLQGEFTKLKFLCEDNGHA